MANESRPLEDTDWHASTCTCTDCMEYCNNQQRQVISMIKCPYCNEEWVREDQELVCKNCLPRLDVDIATAELLTSLNKLGNMSVDDIREREDLLKGAYDKLGHLLSKLGATDVVAT